MNTLKIFFAAALIFSSFEVLSQSTCNEAVFSSDFSTPGDWTKVGTGDFAVSGGSLTFNNVFCPNVNRMYQQIGTTLSNSYWKATCDLTLLSTQFWGQWNQ